jgi:L-iditol 2-dehydrogenase
MKALKLLELAEGRVELCEVPVPEAGPDDVLIKVRYAGICGADVEMYHARVKHGAKPPVILGHEFSGVVAKVGSNVRGLVPGDRVTAETHAVTCGQCTYCRSGYLNLCRERRGLGIGTDGAFAEYVRVPSQIVHLVPKEVSLRAAAVTEPSCVAYNALVEKSRVHPGDTVLVIGPGPIGLLSVQLAKLCGASLVILAGRARNKPRLDIGGQIGADVIIRTDDTELEPSIAELTGGEGVDLVVDAAGNSDALRMAIACVRPMGQITKIGWGPEPVGFSLDPLLKKVVNLQGVFSHTWTTWERCLRLMKYSQLQTEALVTHERLLENWREGISLIERREAVKVLLTP